MMRRSGWLILPLLALWVIPAQAGERLRASWSGASPANAPVWIAVEKGLFKKYEVDVEMKGIGASTIAAQALLAGELDLTVSSVATLVTSRLAGSDVVAIFVSIPTFIDHIVSGPEIREVQDLKGKVGAVNRLGTTSDVGLRLALRKLGLNPEKDLRLIALGDDTARMAGMKSRQVHFTILAEPWVHVAEKLGFRSLLPLAKLGIPFHWNATIARESVIKAKREPIRRFVRAMTEAIAFIKQDGEGTMRIIGQYLKVEDREALRRTWEDYKDVYPVVPAPTPEGVATALAEEAKKRPEAARLPPAAFVDQSFVKELEASGFIAALYRRETR
ncbi:MAG: ABC transporter substrate-binding protein [Deltaproteobacteria bacterium]|nr:ABC transporter substrate-binding protein [Deltaproteobacteria bacterium]